MEDMTPSESRVARIDDLDPSQSLVEPAGRFRLYLGMAAGVGKTVAMLDEGHRRRARGTDVVIGYVEPHERPFTQEKIGGLEIVPRKRVLYRGAEFTELDVAAVLLRRPELVLVDELAHTNIPYDGGHTKRWEDVLALLDAGINVISTLNIQHIESLSDAVEEMTGSKVRERVPDWILRRADQIELVDSSPEQLRRRLFHGNIYPKEKIPLALSSFFKLENLTALRELVLRFVADETEDEMLTYLRKLGAQGVWETRERIMVAITGAEGSEHLLHRAARMAARAKGDLDVVHVHVGETTLKSSRTRIAELKVLASDLGAKWNDLNADDVADAMVGFAKDHRITQLVLGATSQSRLAERFRGSLLNKVLREAGEAGVDVHVIARRVAAETLDESSPGTNES